MALSPPLTFIAFFSVITIVAFPPTITGIVIFHGAKETGNNGQGQSLGYSNGEKDKYTLESNSFQAIGKISHGVKSQEILKDFEKIMDIDGEKQAQFQALLNASGAFSDASNKGLEGSPPKRRTKRVKRGFQLPMKKVQYSHHGNREFPAYINQNADESNHLLSQLPIHKIIERVVILPLPMFNNPQALGQILNFNEDRAENRIYDRPAIEEHLDGPQKLGIMQEHSPPSSQQNPAEDAEPRVVHQEILGHSDLEHSNMNARKDDQQALENAYKELLLPFGLLANHANFPELNSQLKK